MTPPAARANPITTPPRWACRWSVLPRRDRRRAMLGPREAGIAAIEIAVAFPLFLLVCYAIVVGALSALAQLSVQTAAADAARTASLARIATVAQTDAYTAATVTLANQDLRCAATDVTVDTTGLSAPPGQPATVTATVACHLDPSRLGIPVAGALTIQSSMSSPVDTWRSR